MLNNALASEKRQVLRDGGLRKIEMSPDGADAFLSVEQAFEDAEAYRMAERLQDVSPFGIAVVVHGMIYVSGSLPPLSIKIS